MRIRQGYAESEAHLYKLPESLQLSSRIYHDVLDILDPVFDGLDSIPSLVYMRTNEQ